MKYQFFTALTCLIFLVFSATVSMANLKEGLVGYWPLDGDAIDASENGLDGTIKGNVTPTEDRSGNPSSALKFPGSSDSYVDLGDQAAFQITGAMTVTAWVYLDSSNSNNGRIIAKSSSGGSRSWSLNIEANENGVTNPGAFAVASDGNTEARVDDKDPLPTDEWAHLAGVYRPSESVELYVNGELKMENTSDIPAKQFSNNGNPVLIGARNSCGNCGWLGDIDDVAVWNRALSDEKYSSLCCG